METKLTVKKRFPIEKTDEVRALIDKYSYCTENYALTDFEEKAFKVLGHLSEYERVLFYALCEYKSSRKIAALFHTNNNYASQSVKELKAKVDFILKTLIKDE